MKIITIGLDLAKSVFQVHGVDVNGQAMVRKKLRRAEVLRLFEALPTCLVGMAATADDGFAWPPLCR
jgi:transposase